MKRFWTLSRDCYPLLTERDDGMVAIVDGRNSGPVWVTKEQLIRAASLIDNDEKNINSFGGCICPRSSKI